MRDGIIIGTWHETAARELTRCPSYYAADTETLRVKPGDYPARITFEGGYKIPMPYWLLVGIDTERVSGRLYNGCGGLNFSSVELPRGESVTYTMQSYQYEIPKMVADGRLTLRPEFAWLAGDESIPAWQRPGAPQSWEAVRALRAMSED